MGRWWRAYEEAAIDPKLQLLPAELFRTWFNLMCIASKHDGDLPSLAHIAYTLQMKPEKAALALAELHRAGLLDKTETGFTPHNWNGRQFKSDVTDATAAERMRRYRVTKRNNRNAHRNSDVTVTSTRDREQNTDSVTDVTGADAPTDPSIAEREFFDRGKQVCGRSSGGLLAKLLKAKGGNVALARSAIETASQKQNPAEYISACCRDGPLTRPLTEHQRKQQETKDILNALGDFATGGGGGDEADTRLLRHDSGGRSEGFRGRSDRALADLSGRGR